MLGVLDPVIVLIRVDVHVLQLCREHGIANDGALQDFAVEVDFSLISPNPGYVDVCRWARMCDLKPFKLLQHLRQVTCSALGSRAGR